MSKLFKIIVKPVIKNKKGEVFLVKTDNSVLTLPELELDFSYENFNDFLLKKYNITEDKFKIISDKINKRELYGEMIYYIKLNSEDASFIMEIFKSGFFCDSFLENIKNEDKTIIK